jgi:hypothetical protein
MDIHRREINNSGYAGRLGTVMMVNSFFGFTRVNPFKTARSYAVLSLIGFLAFILSANIVIS